jgi:hypothetical protein
MDYFGMGPYVGILFGLTLLCSLVEVSVQWLRKGWLKRWFADSNPKQLAMVLSILIIPTHMQLFNALLAPLSPQIPWFIDSIALAGVVGYFGSSGIHEFANWAGINRDDNGQRICRNCPPPE